MEKGHQVGARVTSDVFQLDERVSSEV